MLKPTYHSFGPLNEIEESTNTLGIMEGIVRCSEGWHNSSSRSWGQRCANVVDLRYNSQLFRQVIMKSLHFNFLKAIRYLSTMFNFLIATTNCNSIQTRRQPLQMTDDSCKIMNSSAIFGGVEIWTTLLNETKNTAGFYAIDFIDVIEENPAKTPHVAVVTCQK
jgi:hypothetical protein